MNEYLFDQSERLLNGSKARWDGKGDAWANAHRAELGSGCFMQDVDACFGTMVFGQNTGERLFLEYVPDDYVNRTKTIRDFAIVAFFDRKASIEAAYANKNLVSRALYVWLCRVLSQYQPIAPRFFYVVGGQIPPWRMIEIDILSDEKTEHPPIEKVTDWKRLWAALGLSELRDALARWVSSPLPAERLTGG